MPVAKYHRRIVMGKAIIYRMRFVKLNNKNMLPTTPTARDAAFNAIHLHNNQSNKAYDMEGI